MKNELLSEVYDLQTMQKFFKVDRKVDIYHISNSCHDLRSELSNVVGICVLGCGVKSLIYPLFFLYAARKYSKTCIKVCLENRFLCYKSGQI
jgi:hypothetical protein